VGSDDMSRRMSCYTGFLDLRSLRPVGQGRLKIWKAHIVGPSAMRIDGW
jgi:hypothetical protein